MISLEKCYGNSHEDRLSQLIYFTVFLVPAILEICLGKVLIQIIKKNAIGSTLTAQRKFLIQTNFSKYCITFILDKH